MPLVVLGGLSLGAIVLCGVVCDDKLREVDVIMIAGELDDEESELKEILDDVDEL